MTTKNLVPRLDGEGKLGVKGASNLKWKEVNATSGSFDLGQIDNLHNQDGNDLIVGGTGVSVTHASGSNGFEYTISSTSTSSTLNDLTDVSITSVADNDLIYYNNTTSSWENINKIDFLYPGSVNYESTTSSTVTVTAADFNTNKYFNLTSSASEIIFDLPDASTVNYGQKVSFYTSVTAKDANVRIRNSSSTFSDFIHTSEPATTVLNSIVIKPNGNLVTVTLLNNGVSGQYIWFVDESASQQIRNSDSSVSISDPGINSVGGTINFTTDNSLRWKINSDGHLLPNSNSGYDIGSAELKVRHLFLSDTSLRFGDAASTTTAPYYLSVDTVNDKFRVSVDGTSTWENIALASEIPSLSGYATETFVSTSINDALQGLDAKEAVDAATTGALTGYNYANNTFTEASATGALTIDGFVLSDDDRVLVKDQGAGNEVQHGIYVVSNIDGASVVTLTRASDITHADTDADDFDGAFVFVLNGTDHAGRSYVAKPTTPGQTTVGSHGMTWVTFTSSATSDLNSLTDVVVTSPESYDALYYDSSTSTWRSGNLNTRSITSDAQNIITFGNSFYTTHTKSITASDFDNNVVFWPQGISASSTGTYEFILPDKTATGNSRLKPGQKIRINTTGLDQDNHTIVIKPHDHSLAPQLRNTYIYPVGTGPGATPASPSITLKKTYGFIEIEVYKNNATSIDFYYNRNHSSIEDLKDVDTTTNAPTNGQVLAWNDTASEWQPTTISSGISNVVEDTAPQLGGDLDVNANEIISASNNNVVLRPNGTGHVFLGGNTNPAEIRLYCETSDAHYVGFKSAAHADYGTSIVWELPTSDGTADQVLKTDGLGVLSWVDQASGGGGFTYSAITADPAPAVKDTHYSCTGTFTITLPAVSGTTAGDQVRVKNIGTGTVTIDGASSETIDGAATFAMDVQWGAITLVSNGSTGWEII